MSGSRDFGKIINERRLSLGYSLGQLANRMGTTATKVRSWERGDAVPESDMIDQLADELNMSVGVLRATLPEEEPIVDDPPVATAAGAGAVFSDAADTAAADVDEELGLDEITEEAAEPDAASAEAPPESETEEAEALGTEAAAGGGPQEDGGVALDDPTAVVAAVDMGDDEPDDDQLDGFDSDADAAAVLEDDGDDRPDIVDLPTEAVPVVPAAPVLEPTGGLVSAPAMVATAPARIDPNDLGIAEPSRMFAPVERFMAVVFDPDKSYLFWIRLALIIVVFIVFLRILAWAVPEFFDVLKDILDTIESTPTEVEPVPNFIEG